MTGPDEGDRRDVARPDMFIDEWLSQEGHGDRRDDLYDGDW